MSSRILERSTRSARTYLLGVESSGMPRGKGKLPDCITIGYRNPEQMPMRWSKRNRYQLPTHWQRLGISNRAIAGCHGATTSKHSQTCVFPAWTWLLKSRMAMLSDLNCKARQTCYEFTKGVSTTKATRRLDIFLPEVNSHQ